LGESCEITTSIICDIKKLSAGSCYLSFGVAAIVVARRNLRRFNRVNVLGSAVGLTSQSSTARFNPFGVWTISS
jgi:hypothetical protein